MELGRGGNPVVPARDQGIKAQSGATLLFLRYRGEFYAGEEEKPGHGPYCGGCL
jgi:hypothetical protein